MTAVNAIGGQRYYAWRPGGVLIVSRADEAHLKYPDYVVRFSGARFVSILENIFDVHNRGALSEQELIRRAGRVAAGEHLIYLLLELLVTNRCLLEVNADFETSSETEYDRFDRYAASHVRRGVGAQQKKALILIKGSYGENYALNRVSPEVPWRNSVRNIDGLLNWSDVAEEVAESEIVGVFGLSYMMKPARELNKLLVSFQKPVVFGNCEGATGRIGPFIYGRSVPCLECLATRILANSSVHESEIYGATPLREVASHDVPVNPFLYDLTLAGFWMELSRTIEGHPPYFIGSYQEYAWSGAVKRHKFLKVPSCRACSFNLPSNYAWSVNEEVSAQ